jgi:aryl-alcohol dehydrogenase-like predicted oxidoreductase
MQKRNFGTTGLKVSPLGFGGGHIGDLSLDDNYIDMLLNSALDLGINLIDTARGYFASEDRIGRFIAHRRQDFVLSTKVGYSIPGYNDWTYDIIIAGVDAALQKLRTEYIDIVHLHSCPVQILQQGDVIEALLKTKQEGKIRCAAYSGDNESLVYAINSGKFDSIQTSINVADQRNINTILKITEEKGMGVIAKRPAANAPWRFKERPNGHYSEVYWDRIHKMGFDFGDKWTETALRFTAYTRGVHSIIVGTSNIDHLKSNLAAIEKGPLEEDVYNFIRNSFMEKDTDWIGQV